MIAGDRNLLNWRDEDENNLLLIAFNNNLSDEVISYLIELIDFRESDEKGITPFFVAIRKGRKKWVDYMIEKGIDVNHTDRESKFTPLMEAVTSNRAEIVRTLLLNGAEIETRDAFGFSAKDFARKMKRIELLELNSEN
jgi:hypothetical protein